MPDTARVDFLTEGLFPLTCPKCRTHAGHPTEIEVGATQPGTKQISVSCHACNYRWNVEWQDSPGATLPVAARES